MLQRRSSGEHFPTQCPVPYIAEKAEPTCQSLLPSDFFRLIVSSYSCIIMGPVYVFKFGGQPLACTQSSITMSSLFFWKEWIREYRYIWYAAAALFFFSLFYLWYAYFTGADSVTHWDK